MQQAIIAAVTFLALSLPLANQTTGKQIVERSSSPNHLYILIYKGNDRGNGRIYISEGRSRKLLFKCDGSHPPEFTWLSNSIASIRIYCGNPCWSVRYYDMASKKLSQEFEFALATQLSSGLVAHVESNDEILVSEIFSGNVRLRYKPTKSECECFAFYAQVRFVDPLTISVKCEETAILKQIPSAVPKG
jgi:hypothetical protein